MLNLDYIFSELMEMQTSYGAKCPGLTLPRKIDLWRVKAGGKQMSFQKSFNHNLLNERTSEIQLLKTSISFYTKDMAYSNTWGLISDIPIITQLILFTCVLVIWQVFMW